MERKKVMVVDDEPDIAKALKIVFEFKGYEVMIAGDSEQCLKLLDEGFFPELIMLDVMLPGMNGYDLCRKLKNDEKYKKIKIIIVSAKSQDFDIKEGMRCGADDYVIKPFDNDDVLTRSHMSLGRQ
jgi:DNA-binding response OmpR family regulator